MPDHFPFWRRVALLVGLMLIVSFVDFCRNGSNAGKYREYGFVIIAGIVGAAVGFLNDLITSSISPEYFTLGKGLEQSQHLRMQAGLFGLQVGFSAGIIGGAVCLFASTGRSSGSPVKSLRLLGLLWMPVAGAILCGIVLPLGFSRFDPARFAAQLDTVLDAEKISRFRQVWWAHLGLYAGMVIGLTAMIFRAARGKKGFPVSA